MDTPQGRIQNILTITNCNCNYAIVCHMLLIKFIYLKTCCKYKSQLHSGHRLPNRRIHERIFFTFFSYISHFYPYYKQQTILLNFLISRKKHKHIDKFKSQNALGFENVIQVYFCSVPLTFQFCCPGIPSPRQETLISSCIQCIIN